MNVAPTRWQTSLERWARATSPRRPSPFLVVVSAVIAALMLLPLAYLLLRASALGWEAVVLMFRPRTLLVLFNSMLLTAVVTSVTVLLGVPLAWLTVRTDLPGRRAWSILTTLPLVIPSYVGAFALVAMMGPRGMLREWLAPLGIERLPEIYGFFGAAWALTLFSYPYVLLNVRAALLRMDPAQEEASRSLGLTSWRTFWRVTLPSLRPALAAGALLVALYVLSDFGAVSLLRFNSFTRAIYVQYQGSFDRSFAAVLSLMLVAVTLLLLAAEYRTRGSARYYRSGTGAGRAARPLALGRWTLPALLFCSGVVVAALILPLGVILVWFGRALRTGKEFLPLASAALHSLQAAGLAALAITLLALPVVYLAVRYPSRFSSLTERASYVGHALPGIVVALSLVFFGANYLTPLYQTLPMLVFAYVVLFLPQAQGSQRASLMQINPRLEEAARSLGKTPMQTVRRVTLPLLAPGLAAGTALVFLTTMKELPATLLLAPTGFTTLAIQIWSATEAASYARASAPALLLVMISALSLIFLIGRENRSAS